MCKTVNKQKNIYTTQQHKPQGKEKEKKKGRWNSRRSVLKKGNEKKKKTQGDNVGMTNVEVLRGR